MAEENQLPVKVSKGEVVKWNALKHGILSKETVLPSELPEEFEILVHRLIDRLNPSRPLEALLVGKIAVTLWRLKRAYRYEAGAIRLNELKASDDQYAEEAERIATDIKKIWARSWHGRKIQGIFTSCWMRAAP